MEMFDQCGFIGLAKIFSLCFVEHPSLLQEAKPVAIASASSGNSHMAGAWELVTKMLMFQGKIPITSLDLALEIPSGILGRKMDLECFWTQPVKPEIEYI